MTMHSTIAAARLNGPQAGADGTVVLEFRFGAGDPVFAGHFPGRPLVPGVFQLEMARLAAEWTLDCPLTICDIGRAKFLRPILPDETLRLELKMLEKDGIIRAHAGFSVGGRPAGEADMQLSRAK